MVGGDEISQEKNWNERNRRSRMEAWVIPKFNEKEEEEKSIEVGWE